MLTKKQLQEIRCDAGHIEQRRHLREALILIAIVAVVVVAVSLAVADDRYWFQVTGDQNPDPRETKEGVPQVLDQFYWWWFFFASRYWGGW
jgi:hypothetical protein